MTLLVIFAVVSIAVSFLCSLLESALLSLTPSFIAQLREPRPNLHKALNRLKENIDKPLAAILTLNTVAHTVGATGVGAQVTVVFGEAYLGWASAIMTILILVLSEIIPKTIGAKYWRQLSPLLPPILDGMTLLLKPFIWLSDLITNRIGGKTETTDIREEIKALAQIGWEEKALDTDEKKVITNILNLHTIQLKKIMTPRTVAISIPPELTVAETIERVGDAPFTRFPVMGDVDKALGFVHKADIYQADADLSLSDVMRDIETVSAEESVERVFMLMLREGHHLCVVYDELGTWVGIVTMEDILEAILGQDIVDETDDVPNLRRYAKERWSKRLAGGAGSSPR